MKKLLLPLTISLAVGTLAACDADEEEIAYDAPETEATALDERSTAMNDQSYGDEYDSDWPADGDMESDIYSEDDSLASTELDNDPLTPPAQEDMDYDTLDPTGEDELASTESSADPYSQFDTLDPEEDTELGEDDEVTAEAELDSDDGEIILAAVRLNEEERTLEMEDGDSYVAVQPEQVEVIFQTADSNGDAQLDREEAVEIDGLAAIFADLDEDGDGTLVLTEFDSLEGTA